MLLEFLSQIEKTPNLLETVYQTISRAYKEPETPEDLRYLLNLADMNQPTLLDQKEFRKVHPETFTKSVKDAKHYIPDNEDLFV